MATPKDLLRPPIIEALVDVRAEVAQPIEVLEALADEFKADFPNKKHSRMLKAELKVQGNRLTAPETQDLGLQGLHVFNADESMAVQFKLDGFTVNNMKAYIGGEQLIARAMALWEAFANRTQVTTTSRIAMRYINKLDLPFNPGDDFRKFLTASPELPKDLPEDFSEFLTRVVAHDRVPHGPTLIVTQHFVSVGIRPTVVIDLDAFKMGEFSADPVAVAQVLQELRALAKRAFFSLITDETAKLYS